DSLFGAVAFLTQTYFPFDHVSHLLHDGRVRDFFGETGAIDAAHFLLAAVTYGGSRRRGAGTSLLQVDALGLGHRAARGVASPAAPAAPAASVFGSGAWALGRHWAGRRGVARLAGRRDTGCLQIGRA